MYENAIRIWAYMSYRGAVAVARCAVVDHYLDV
jgi:hypothetical protein